MERNIELVANFADSEGQDPEIAQHGLIGIPDDILLSRHAMGDRKDDTSPFGQVYNLNFPNLGSLNAASVSLVGGLKMPEENAKKPRRKSDRFDGMPEEIVALKTLPDYMDFNLELVIVGYNPGLMAAHKGHYYPGPGNHFWKCLHLSGLVPKLYTSDDDQDLLKHGIGLTNIVSRTTRSSSDLSKLELREGANILLEKIQAYKPKIVVFNGKGIFEAFAGRKVNSFGYQLNYIPNTTCHSYILPSSSARCAQLPRADDKVPYYIGLKKFKDFVNGHIPRPADTEITFPLLTSKKGLKRKSM